MWTNLWTDSDCPQPDSLKCHLFFLYSRSSSSYHPQKISSPLCCEKMQIAYTSRTTQQKNVVDSWVDWGLTSRLTKVQSSQLVSWLWCEHGLRLYTSGKLYRLRSLGRGGGVLPTRQNGIIWALLRLTWIYELLLGKWSKLLYRLGTHHYR